MASDDRGNMISGWLIRLVLGLVIAGVVCMDAISVGSARMQTEDAAAQAAFSAAEVAKSRQPLAKVVEAANTTLHTENPRYVLDPRSVRVGRDGSVTLTVSRTAKTLVLGRIKPLAKYATYSFTASSAEGRANA